VRSALLAVKGVTRAVVELEGHLATVTYDPREATVEKMIEAVNREPGPTESIRYFARVQPAQ
jgi:copper chaperone CopZ